MRYIIIGLGIYGANLARDLTAMGHEVIGADNNPVNVDNIKEYISTVYQVDATEEASLSVLPLKNVDLVIVAIGENFGASVRAVALLKQAGVEHIYARAIDPLHQAILESFNIDRILTPEQRAAEDLTHEMALGSRVDVMMLDRDTLVARFTAPAFLVGRKYSDTILHDRYGLHLVAATRPRLEHDVLGNIHPVQHLLPVAEFVSDAGDDAPSDEIHTDDVLTVVGPKKKFQELYKDLAL